MSPLCPPQRRLAHPVLCLDERHPRSRARRDRALSRPREAVICSFCQCHPIGPPWSGNSISIERIKQEGAVVKSKIGDLGKLFDFFLFLGAFSGSAVQRFSGSGVQGFSGQGFRGQRSAVGFERSAVSYQRSAVSGQRSAVSYQLSAGRGKGGGRRKALGVRC